MTNGRGHMRISVVLLLVLSTSGSATAQSLEETVLTLERAGAVSSIRQETPGVIVADNLIEVRVVDPATCTVRITQRHSEPTTVGGSWDKNAPAIDVGEFMATHKEVYLGRVIPADIKKVPQVLGTKNGIVVEKLDDANWRLPGSPGDKVWCNFWRNGTKYCKDNLEYSRLSLVRDLPDWNERAARVDRALVHLYADLCKGAQKRVPF